MRGPETIQGGARRWSALDLVAMTVITVGGGILRVAGLGDPSGIVFDETYYARDACWYIEVSEKLCGVGPTHAEVHPPLAKWALAAGIRLFGYDAFGWRFGAALAGTITIALTYLLARRILGSTLGATVAAALLTVDLLHFVQSRIAMLDVFVALFGTAAVLFAVLDRDRPRPTEPEPARTRRLLDRLLARPWRLAAGAAAGAALASKWSGVLFVAGVLTLTIAWERGARRRDRSSGALRRVVIEEGPAIAAWLVIVPLVVYTLSYVGRLHGPTDSCGEETGTWVNQLVQTQVCMYEFHAGLEAMHPYQSPAWSWPLLKRPVSYFFQTQADGDYMEILATGSPFTWWPSLIALSIAAVVMARNWRRGRAWGRPEGVIVGGFCFAYLPWLVLAGDRSAVFLFYFVTAVPFMCVALGYVAARLGTSWEARAAIAVFAALTLGSFVFYRPLLVKSPLPRDQWLERIWIFDDCATTKVAGRGTATTGPAERTPTNGWCWI